MSINTDDPNIFLLNPTRYDVVTEGLETATQEELNDWFEWTVGYMPQEYDPAMDVEACRKLCLSYRDDILRPLAAGVHPLKGDYE